VVAGQQQQQQEEGQEQQPRVSLKWPNDILLGESKVAGVLIEAELPFLLVGIGVNVRHKPEVPRHGPDRGRPATCLADFGVDSTDEVGVGRLFFCFVVPCFALQSRVIENYDLNTAARSPPFLPQPQEQRYAACYDLYIHPRSAHEPHDSPTSLVP